MNEQTFTTLAIPGKATQDALLLAASIRHSAGSLAEVPIWVFVPQLVGAHSTEELAQFSRWQVDIIPLPLDRALAQFPFAAKVAAAATAEQMTGGQSELLTWLDADTLVLTEPLEFLLPPPKALGYRPVHHRLIGPAWGQPLDPFWQLIYHHCHVPPVQNLAMKTHVGEKTRPYFNAGSFVVRPERGLMALWWDRFQTGYRLPEFEKHYEADTRYAIFMHQAIFTGVILHALTQNEMQTLGTGINYPLHLHDDIPAQLQAATIGDLITIRHESLLHDPEWLPKLPFAASLQDRLQELLPLTQT